MKHTIIRTAAVLLACLCVLSGCLASASSYAILEAAYPEMAPYPNEQDFIDPVSGFWDSDGFEEVYEAWRTSRIEQRSQPEGYTEGTAAITRRAAETFLTDADGNAVISPLNVYLTLGMLAEVTGGESREQILALLGADSMDTLRRRAGSLWNANYCDDGALTSVLASSLWLDRDVAYRTEPLEMLASVYHASSYQGEMGDPAFDKALQTWLNEQTGGLLQEAAEKLTMSPETILTLASTVYYQAKWKNEFREENNAERTFHSPAGDVACTFMTQTDTYGVYYWSQQFGAVARPMEEGGRMWLILPDEGVDTDAVLRSDALYNLLDPAYEWTDRKTLIIHQYIPKFDISSDRDILEGLAALGITDVMDPAAADFTPLTDTEGAYLFRAEHTVRVAIDEDGVTAAAFTAMMTAGAAMPPEEEMDFVLDRPFLFAITGQDDVILFMGVVDRP